MVITTQRLIGRRDRPFPGCWLKHTTDKRLMAGFRPLRKNVLFHLLKFFFGYLAFHIPSFQDIQGALRTWTVVVLPRPVTCKPFKCSLGQTGFLEAVRLQIQREPKVVCNKGGGNCHRSSKLSSFKISHSARTVKCRTSIPAMKNENQAN
jgi:hypothetical protein